MLLNDILTEKPFKSIHSDPKSHKLDVTKIKEEQKMYSLESQCFLESTGIYLIPLLYFLCDKGFDCSVINPIITKNSTNINIRKLHSKNTIQSTDKLHLQLIVFYILIFSPISVLFLHTDLLQ